MHSKHSVDRLRLLRARDLCSVRRLAPATARVPSDWTVATARSPRSPWPRARHRILGLSAIPLADDPNARALEAVFFAHLREAGAWLGPSAARIGDAGADGCAPLQAAPVKRGALVASRTVE